MCFFLPIVGIEMGSVFSCWLFLGFGWVVFLFVDSFIPFFLLYIFFLFFLLEIS
jgi:hypothetical protein